MIQRGGGPRLLHEAPLALRIRDLLGRQHLKRDEAFEMRVAGAVDHAHAAFSSLFQHFVMRDRATGHSGPRIA